MTLMPWKWSMKGPEDSPNQNCPSPSKILGTFAIANLATTLLSLVIGNSFILGKVSFGILGRYPTPLSVLSGWILPVALQLAANTIIAFLIKHTAGYGDDFSVAELVFFLIARPRLSWIVFLCIGAIKAPRAVGESKPSVPPYASTSMAQGCAEIIMQLISCYYMGRTAHFAASHGYLVPGRLSGPVGHAAQLMYSASLFWLTLGLIAAIICGIGYPSLALSEDMEARLFTTISAPEKPLEPLVLGQAGAVLIPIVIVNWLACWLFWAGFVKLSGSL